MTDVELLKQHRAGSGDGCFAQLVRRHAGWIYGVARRRLGDSHLADDVVQAVFILLHRKSPDFSSDRSLVAWLHRTAWYSAEVADRQRRRRRHHESEAAMVRAAGMSETREWEKLAPLLDSLIERLRREDREAILLRYYRQMSYEEVASALGATEEAARKRVDRAVEKLRRLAGRNAAEMSTEEIAAQLEREAAREAPAGVIAAATGAALAPRGSAMSNSGSTIAKGAKLMMIYAKARVAAAIVAALMVSGGMTLALVAAQPPASKPSQQPQAEQKDYPKLAPYLAIRWNKDVPEVQLEGKWYELQAINDVAAPDIIAFAKARYRRDTPRGKLPEWQRRFGEDLVEVMGQMGKEPGETVKLKLRDLSNGETIEPTDVPNTQENRQEIFRARLEADNN